MRRSSGFIIGLVGVFIVCAGFAAAADVVNNLVDPYLRIHASLTKDSTDGVKDNARAIVTEAESLGGGAIKLRDAARALEAAGDLKAARAAFGPLTDALLAYANETKMVLPDDLKLAYCPMVKKSWLQKGETIANPYYGSEMLTCGDFRKR
jgi:hypothetical protein